VIPVYKKGDQQKLENYRGINLINACYKPHIKILKEKLTAQTEKFLLECQNGFRKGVLYIKPLVSMKITYRKKRRKFNSETHLPFLDYVKAFNKIERDKLFEILQSKNIPVLLLTF
jgi:hypothetical protein